MGLIVIGSGAASVSRATTIIAACWAVAMIVGTARGEATEPADRAGYDGWRGGFSLTPGILSIGIDGASNGRDGSGAPVRPATAGGSRLIAGVVDFSVWLDSARIDALPLAPRVFASGEAIVIAGKESSAASEGGEPPLLPPEILLPFDEVGISGQGSRTNVEPDLMAYGVTLGLAFPLESGGHRFEFRPGVSWMSWGLEIEGSMSRAIMFVSPGREFRSVLLDARSDTVIHGIGPSATLEWDLGELGSSTTAFYLQGAGYRVLSDQTVRLSSSTVISDTFGVEAYSADWTIDIEDWFYRFGLGVRITLGDARH